MKKVLILLLLICTNALHASEWARAYVAIASSGPGGSIMGHSYFLFCKDHMVFKIRNCQAVEFNLDINNEENYEKTIQLSALEKFEALKTAKFQVIIHHNAAAFQGKYLERGQSITYYQYKGEEKKVSMLYKNLMAEKEKRDRFPKNDYSINGNNCATKILEAFEEIEGAGFNMFEKASFYDLDQYLYQFPIYLRDSIERSGLFPSAIEFSDEGYWRSFRVY